MRWAGPAKVESKSNDTVHRRTGQDKSSESDGDASVLPFV